MGAKIGVDSATMMNKGLELIEAHHLFPVGLDRIRIVVHPQSVIHSMVEYRDGSTLAQLGPSDMRVPIASCLAWPQRMDTPCEPLDLPIIGELSFFQPDEQRFPATRLAREAQSGRGGPRRAERRQRDCGCRLPRWSDRVHPHRGSGGRHAGGREHAATPRSLEEVLQVDADVRVWTQELLEKA